MFNQILVPLDGSSFSEAVLPQVSALAQCTGAKVTLLRVIPTILYNLGFAATTRLPLQANPEYDSRTVAETYLERIASEHFPGNLNVQIEVMSGVAADVIYEYAIAQKVDAIAMTTHGRSGMSRLMLGSVAEEIVQRSHLPVLLVRPTPEPIPQHAF